MEGQTKGHRFNKGKGLGIILPVMREIHDHKGLGKFRLRVERFSIASDAFVRLGDNTGKFAYQSVFGLTGIHDRGRFRSANSWRNKGVDFRHGE